MDTLSAGIMANLPFPLALASVVPNGLVVLAAGGSGIPTGSWES
ncbi:hypothetical protein [Nocardia stercoris]|nr:hypothetical protein [Nocardia stercoris]